MPSVNALEQILSYLEFWQHQKQYYFNTHVDFYTQQYIAKRIAECDQRLAKLQLLINE